MPSSRTQRQPRAHPRAAAASTGALRRASAGARRARARRRPPAPARSRSASGCARTRRRRRPPARCRPGTRSGHAHSRPNGSAREDLREPRRRASSAAPRASRSTTRIVRRAARRRRRAGSAVRSRFESQAQPPVHVQPRQHARDEEADAAVDVVEHDARAALASAPAAPNSSHCAVSSRNGSKAIIAAEKIPRFTIAAMLPCSPTSSTSASGRVQRQKIGVSTRNGTAASTTSVPRVSSFGDRVREVLAHLQAQPGDDPLLVQHVVDRGPVLPGRPDLVDVVEPVDDRDLQQQAQHRQRRAGRVVGRGHAGRQLAPASRCAARACWPARRRPRTGARSAGTPSRSSARRSRRRPSSRRTACGCAGWSSSRTTATWNSRVRQPIRKQKKQKKQIDEPERRLLGERRHEEEREQPRQRRAPEHGVVGEHAGVRVELADPGDPAQQIADQHQREEDPPQRQRARIELRDRCGAAQRGVIALRFTGAARECTRATPGRQVVARPAPDRCSVRAIPTGPSFDPLTSCQTGSGTSTMAVSGRGGTPGEPISRRPRNSTSNAQRDRNGVDSAADSAGAGPEQLRPALGVVDAGPQDAATPRWRTRGRGSGGRRCGRCRSRAGRRARRSRPATPGRASAAQQVVDLAGRRRQVGVQVADDLGPRRERVAQPLAHRLGLAAVRRQRQRADPVRALAPPAGRAPRRWRRWTRRSRAATTRPGGRRGTPAAAPRRGARLRCSRGPRR